jgi:ssDNA-binding Zn-finger/Zn-ribbon topoisomerase 1
MKILKEKLRLYRENKNGSMLYVCAKYPACDAYVRVIPGSKTPVGSLADGTLRALRLEAHRYFDKLHLSGMMSKSDAYQWLADILQAPQSQAHIGYVGEYYCRKVIQESKRLLDKRRQTRRGQSAAASSAVMGV